MSKKVILTENQFKNYMRRLLKEDTAGSQAKITYSRLAERAKLFADYIESMGNEYVNLYDLILSQIKGYGIKVNGITEGIGIDDNPSLSLSVDISNAIQTDEYTNDYDNNEEWLEDKLYYELNDDIIRNSSLKYYFRSLEISFKNGVINITPYPIDWLSVENIKNKLPEEL